MRTALLLPLAIADDTMDVAWNEQAQPDILPNVLIECCREAVSRVAAAG